MKTVRGTPAVTRLALACLLAAIIAGTAKADGLPVVGVDTTADGVVGAGGGVRFVAVAAGSETLVARVQRDGGRLLASRSLRGAFSVPAVAYDGSAGGLSADGKTLVLIRPRARFPRAATTFAILDARRLVVRRILRLRGDFSFDAVSPDGSALYLVNYTAPDDPTRYRVRVYDLAVGRMDPKPIVDPREPGEAMRGLPITRATSPDGRWAYTLYDGAGDHPFVHALDLERRTARCIDLDALAGRKDLSALRLRTGGDGRTLTVANRKRPLATVDTRTFLVTEPAATREGRGVPWAPLAAVAAVLAAAAIALAARARVLRSAELGQRLQVLRRRLPVGRAGVRPNLLR